MCRPRLHNPFVKVLARLGVGLAGFAYDGDAFLERDKKRDNSCDSDEQDARERGGARDRAACASNTYFTVRHQLGGHEVGVLDKHPSE